MRFITSVALVLLSSLHLACDREAEQSPDASQAAPAQTASSPAGPRIAATIPLKIGTPSSVAVNPTTRVVYVAYRDIDVLSLFDANSYEPKGTVDLPPGGLHSVAVNPVTDKIYVANGGNGSVTVLEGRTNEIAKSIDVAAHSEFFGVPSIFSDPRNNRIYVARVHDSQDRGLAVIDGETDAEMAQVKLDGAAGRMTLDPSGRDLYVIIEYSVQLLSLCPNYRLLVVIDTEANSLRECLDFGYFPIAVGISPDGSTLYYFSVIERQTTLTIVERSSQRALTTIKHDFTSKEVTVDADSRRLYVMADNSGDCCVLGTTGQLLAMDPDGKTVVWSVGIGSGPIDLASDLDAARFYVVTADRSLQVIEQ